MSNPEPISARLRLQALLAIPDRQRTEAEWDELNQLEIMLAPGNREGAVEQGARGNSAARTAHPKASGRPDSKNPVKKSHRRRHKGI